MAVKKFEAIPRDMSFILGNSLHRLMIEVARVKKSRKKPASSLEELAGHFFSAAVYRQMGKSARQVKFPRPWSYNKAVAWLAHYAKEIANLMDREGIGPLLMEAALAPYPLCKNQSLFAPDMYPDLIARRTQSGDLAILDYKTVALAKYGMYKEALEGDNLQEALHTLDQLVGYAAAAEHDKHAVNEKVDEIGLIIIPRTPLNKGTKPLPVLFLCAPFDRSKVKDWHSRQLEKILFGIAADENDND